MGSADLTIALVSLTPVSVVPGGDVILGSHVDCLLIMAVADKTATLTAPP